MNPSLFALCAIVMSLLCVFAAAVPDAGAAATAEGDRDGLAGIVAPGAMVEKLAGDLKFTEGPVYDPAGFLLFSDIPADTLYRYTPGSPGKLDVFRQPSGQANGNTRDREGRLITCEHKNRRVSRTEKDGRVVTLAERFEGKRLNSPNDVVVKSDGSIYFTDPPYGIGREQEELGFYGVYRLTADGTLTLLVRDFVRPNGLAFSPDESKLYVDDSQEGHIRVFDVRKDGTLANGRVFAELKAPGKRGVPDGMKVDTRGNVYCTGPEGVWVFDKSGTLKGKIIGPEVPANVAFGDRDYKTLYITAQTGLYRIRLQIAGVRPARKAR
jgi:gluconolactonase